MRTLFALLMCLAVAQALPRIQKRDAKARYPHYIIDEKQGLNFEFTNSRIHDGYPAYEGEFPFIVHVQMFAEDLSSYVCGGSLISNDIVVTAAHCILDVTPSMGISVQYGVIDWTLALPNQKQDFLFDYMANPNFQGFSYIFYPISSDIGWVRLDTPLDPADWDGLVDIIPISDVEPEINDLVTMIGWGGTEAYGPVSYTLNYGYNYVVSDTMAFEIFGADSFVPAEFFCVDSNSHTDHSGTCGGDSGGPITDEEYWPDTVLYGATSFGMGNCELGVSCFTNVVYFRDWLTETTGENFGP